MKTLKKHLAVSGPDGGVNNIGQSLKDTIWLAVKSWWNHTTGIKYSFINFIFDKQQLVKELFK